MRHPSDGMSASVPKPSGRRRLGGRDADDLAAHRQASGGSADRGDRTVGRPFDPRFAAAVSTVEDPAAADGIVVEETRPGFLWQDELLRPAEVIVARRYVRNGANT